MRWSLFAKCVCVCVCVYLCVSDFELKFAEIRFLKKVDDYESAIFSLLQVVGAFQCEPRVSLVFQLNT